MPQCSKCKSEVHADARFCASCGAVVLRRPDSADPFIGQTVADKYVVEQLLGTGGMGRVYKARHRTLDRPFVLKILNRDLLSDPSIVERFQREALAASRLSHANSISIIDFGRAEDGTLYIVMEHVPGRNLAKLLAQDFPLAQERVVRIVSQILAALAEAHAAGIIHRDLKPENVMVENRRDQPDFVKVLDFGIAKLNDPGSDSAEKLTRAGMVCGTPGYMSPEQARGEELDVRSDLYSVGVILYELITGRQLFEATTPMALVNKHLVEEPIPPRERRPDLNISPDLDVLVTRVLSKERDDRPASAEQMREELLACAIPEGALSRATTVQKTVVLPIEGGAAAAPKPVDRPVTTPSPSQRIRLVTPPAPERQATPARQRSATPRPPSTGSSSVVVSEAALDAGPSTGDAVPAWRKLPVIIGGAGAAAVVVGVVAFLLIPRSEPARPEPRAVPTLRIEVGGNGRGTVTSNPEIGLDCGTERAAACAVQVPNTQGPGVVKLVATPEEGSTFVGWSGDCSGGGSCSVTLDAARTVVAEFARKSAPPPPADRLTLTVDVSGDGAGAVTAGSDVGLDCSGANPGGCKTEFAVATPPRTVKLVAKPAAGSKFEGWSGACTGTSSCSVAMDANKTVGASFAVSTPAPNPVRGVCYGLNCMSVPSKASKEGVLSVDATPWAYVFVEGRRVGNKETPLEVKVAEGTYTVRARHPELGTQSARLTVKAGARTPWKPALTKK